MALLAESRCEFSHATRWQREMKKIARGRGRGGILRRRMSIKRRGRLTITETSTKAIACAPFRTLAGSSRDNLYGNSRDVISPPWQTLATTTREARPRTAASWADPDVPSAERTVCPVHIITKSGHRFIGASASDRPRLQTIRSSCSYSRRTLSSARKLPMLYVRTGVHCQIFPGQSRFYALDLINTVSLTFVTSRRAPIAGQR